MFALPQEGLSRRRVGLLAPKAMQIQLRVLNQIGAAAELQLLEEATPRHLPHPKPCLRAEPEPEAPRESSGPLTSPRGGSAGHQPHALTSPQQLKLRRSTGKNTRELQRQLR